MSRYHRRQLPKSILANQVFFAPLTEIQAGKVVVPTHFPVLGDVTGAVMSSDGGIFFDGVNDVITFIDADDSKYLGNTTICIWSKIDAGGVERHFCGKHAGNGGTNNPFDFRTDNAATPLMILVVANASGYVSHAGPTVVLNRYAHYAVTIGPNNESTSTFYVNGAPTTGSQTVIANGARTGSGANIRTGLRADGAAPMNGSSTKLRVFNRQLARSEIEQVMQFDNPL